ncbi:MAG: hypothetical protein A2792_00205 [Sphingomonadales bacterium RIFCSPHIGHO2_01_FULL_65_20]|nr:MAG: hypothetical protein A2792_00205 [Sphingomonadales bacterium RIFCSPHIGHO2_01_FULL_65_20]
MPKKAKSGEQPCPACREPCSVEAIICPHCRTTFTQAQIDERKKAESDKNKAGLWGCGGLIAIVLVIGMCSSPAKKDGDDKAIGQVAGTATPASKAPAGNAKDDAIALFRAMISATSACDAASKSIPAAMQNGDMVAAYRAADRAERACLSVANDIRAIDVPASLGSAHVATAKKALEACDTAYVSKWAGADKLKDIIDGESKPSDLAELQDTASLVQAGQMLCAGGLMNIANELGATNADLGIEDTK